MSLDNKVVDLADLKVSHDYLLEQDGLLSDRIDELGSGIDDVESIIGDLSNLSTTLKDSIVSAINEVLQTGGRVKSVNSKTGDVVLKTSDLTNDSGYLTSYTETDPTVPSWAKQVSKPTYTAQEVGASSVEDMNSEVNTRRAADAQLQSQITALGNGAPIPVGTVAEMIDNTKAYLYTGAEVGWLTGYWYTYDSAQAKFVPRGEYGVGTVIDNTLTVSGDAADAKATGDAISEVNGRLGEFTTAVTYAENTNFADRIESPLQAFQFADANIGIVKFAGVVPNNGKFIASSGSDTFGFYNPFYGFEFEIASSNGGVFSVASKPTGDVGETLDGIEEITGVEDGYYKKYTVNLPKMAYVIFAYRKVDMGNIKIVTNNHYTIPGAEFDSVQDHFLRYSNRNANTNKGLVITKLENKLVNTTSGAVSDSAQYDTYYLFSPVSELNVTCKNGFRAVITIKDPTTISTYASLVSVVYANASERVETFSVGLGQYVVISVAHTAGDIDIVTDYVKTFSLPTLRLSYQQKNGFYRIAKSGSATYLYIYMVSGDKVVQWQLHNVPGTSSNSNTWQIGHVMGYDYDGQSLSNGIELVAGGEFELAFKEYGSADYCGGNNHGDENTIDFTLMIDGKTVDFDNIDGEYHAFDRIDAVEHAYVNRCDTPAENILKHQKIWMFENGTVKVRQTLEFLESLECDFLCCMLAANRSAFTHGVRQGWVGIEDMSTSSFDRVRTDENEMMYLMYGPNATAKVTARTCDHTPKASLWINNASTLNKLYYNFYGQMPRTAVESGTILRWESEYDIAYN